MYIEFTLPSGAGGMAAAHTGAYIEKALKKWSDRYGIPYNKKIHKYTLRVTFDSDDTYTFFGLTWVPDPKYLNWTSYRLIEPMNRV
jgi:hypothetical protein